MVSAAIGKLLGVEPQWRRDDWIGPVFRKELQVASRRRRSYVLRLIYVLALIAFIVAVWVAVVHLAGGGAMSRAQMQVAAHRITMGIVWFQFWAAQLVALVLMSTTISDEVHGRTLGILMTAPLRGTQIVMNKFCSRMIQLLLLVATSLPLLALVRVLGGIPWSYLIVSLCVTATTVLFIGAVSLFFSALCRRAYLVVFLGAATAVFFFVLVPFFSVLLLHPPFSEREILGMSLFGNPYLLLYRYTDYAFSPRGPAFVSTLQIVSCCVLLLAAAGLVLRWAVRLVESVALRRAMGDPIWLDRLGLGRWRTETRDAGPGRRPCGIRRVVGAPMIWKETTCRLSDRQKFATRLIVGLEILLILIVYLFPAMMSIVPYPFLHLVLIWILLGLGVLGTLTASATVISLEREAQTWPLLLLTPLTDWEILAGKFVGVLRRSGPVWLSLLAYLAAFTYGRCFHPRALTQGTMLVLTVLLFLTATGLYFGARLRRTAEAVTANLVCAGVLWCVVPLLGAAAELGMRKAGVCEGVALLFVPFVQAFALVATTLDGYAGGIRCFDQYLRGPDVTRWIFFSMMGYLLASLVFAWRGVRAFRRHIV
jgi:ABC-type transport system involved in multi-copper enzyme maturation permease subunit